MYTQGSVTPSPIPSTIPSSPFLVGNQFYYFLCYQSCITFCKVIQIRACFLIFSSFLQKKTQHTMYILLHFLFKICSGNYSLSVYKGFSIFFFYQFPVLQSVYLSQCIQPTIIVLIYLEAEIIPDIASESNLLFVHLSSLQYFTIINNAV